MATSFSGNTFKEHREARGLTQQSIADKMHLTRPVISNWERGQSEPNASQLIKLAQFYQVTVDALVGNSVERLTTVVMDTSSLLKRPSYLQELCEVFNRIVIPDIVIAELNHQKDKGKPQVKQKAWLVMMNIDQLRDSISIPASRSDKGNNDEKIMAVAAQCAKNEPTSDVYVLSDDIYFKHLTRQYRDNERLTNLVCLDTPSYVAQFLTKSSTFDLLRTQEFYSLIKNGALEKVKAFEMKGVDLNYRCPSEGLTPLIAAVRKKDLKLVEHLVQLPDLDLDECDKFKYGFTAVHHATQLKNVALLKCLISNGADPDRGSSGRNQGNTALMLAAWSNFGKCLDYLLSVGACANQQDNNGFSPLIKACIKRNHEAVVKLLPHSDLNIRCRNNKKAIEHLDPDHPANFKIMKLLKEKYDITQ